MARDLNAWRGCQPPQPIVLDGRFVSLVPFEPARHAGALWDAFGGRDGCNALLRYFPQPEFDTVDDFENWLIEAQGPWLTFVFIRPDDDAVIGMASYMRIDAANGSIEVGSVAHGLQMARTPAATEAHYLMARHVFDTLGYRRYEWKCHNENAASKRAAERLGFTFEGVFRQHMVAKGRNRDTAWYAMIDAEWPVLRSAFEAWLSPGNFDADGLQRRSLEDIRSHDDMRLKESGDFRI